MAYLDNSTVTVDAVLTKKGRELLSKGKGAFKITKFALSDDEVDYSLWNPLHPSGSSYYGNVIENMPVLEAMVDESQTMRYKLLSIDDVLSTATTVNLPYIELSYLSDTIVNGQTVNIDLSDANKIITFTPATHYMLNGIVQNSNLDSIRQNFGYTFIINKAYSDIVNDSKGMFASSNQFVGVESKSVTATTQQFSGDGDFTAVTRVGSALKIHVNSAGLVSTNVTLPFSLPITVLGNQSGTTFNMILQFNIPNAYRSIMGTGFVKGSGAGAATTESVFSSGLSPDSDV